jgi:hypothetical protein
MPRPFEHAPAQAPLLQRWSCADLLTLFPCTTFASEHPTGMIIRTVILSALIATNHPLSAQSQVSFSHVQLMEKEGTREGNDLTIPLSKEKDHDWRTLYSDGELSCRIAVKVNRQSEPSEGRKDDRVNLIFEIDMNVGKLKDKKIVEKVFRLDRTPTRRVSQIFTFTIAGRVRNITLVLDAEIS